MTFMNNMTIDLLKYVLILLNINEFLIIFKIEYLVYYHNKMSEKLSLRLKTVDVADIISLKTKLSLPYKTSTNGEINFKNKIKHKT